MPKKKRSPLRNKRCGKGKIMRLRLAISCWLLASVSLAQSDIWRQDSVQEVVITGTGTQHLLKDAPVQTEVISHRQLQQYAGRSIEDILSGLTASFDFSENDMGSHLQMNGLGNSYVLILIDGHRLYGDNGGENDLALIDPHNIEKIEIVKGASSALYGSDAIAGVINIITKKHREKGLMFENTSRVGSYGDIRQHDGLALNFGKLSSYTNFQLQHSDGWQNTSEEAIQQTEYHITDSRNKTVNRHTNWQLAERLTYQLTPQIELYADGSIYWKRIYRPCGHHPGVDVKTWDLQYDNASLSAGGKWKLNATDYITLDADWKKHAYYYAYTDTTLTDGYVNGRFTNYFPYFPGDRELQSDQRLTNILLKGVFELPYAQRLSAGLEYRYDWLKAPMRVAGGKATDNTESVYVQDELELLDPLYITAGLRLTRNEGFGVRLTPKISAMLKLGERLGARYANEVIVISDVIKNILAEKYHRTDTHLIYNGVPTPNVTDYPEYFKELGIEKGRYILAMCRFVPEKKLDHLVAAYQQLLSKGETQGIRLVLAGDADFEDSYSRRLKSEARACGAVLTGFVKGRKLQALLTGARCFVLPSSHEGLPIALLEAMGYGLPAIVSDIPANLEVGLPAKCYFPLGDIDALVARLAANISGEYHHVDYDMSKYDWDVIARQVSQVYQSTNKKR